MSETEHITNLVKGAALVPSILTDARGVQHAFLPGTGGSFTRQEITPKGEIAPKPAFIDQIVNLDQAASLVDYVLRFKTADTVIFVDVDDTQVVAVIDYHKASSTGPGLVEHRAVLDLTLSSEWETWASISGRMYDQKSFARMIDVNSDDIVQPAAADLLEKVMDLEMATTVTVQRKLASSGSSRGSGSVARQTSGTELPPFFLLSIPVFTGEQQVEVRAMTLDSQDGNTGKISLGLELVRTRIIKETELARIARAIASATSVPVMLGSLPA